MANFQPPLTIIWTVNSDVRVTLQGYILIITDQGYRDVIRRDEIPPFGTVIWIGSESSAAPFPGSLIDRPGSDVRREVGFVFTHVETSSNLVKAASLSITDLLVPVLDRQSFQVHRYVTAAQHRTSLNNLYGIWGLAPVMEPEVRGMVAFSTGYGSLLVRAVEHQHI